MYYDLKKMFWWPVMKGDVATVVSKCLTCQKVKIEHQKLSGMLQPLEIPQWKWEEIAMDFVIGLSRTRSGFNAFWVIVDCLTKSAHFLPIRVNCSMEELARLYIKEIVRLHAETTEKIKKISERTLTAQSQQKSYVDQRRKPLEFDVGEHVFLRVTPTTGIGRAIKTKKLNLKFIRPFEILRRFGLLRKYTSDKAHVLEPESVDLRENLTFQVTPVCIDETSVKKLRGKEVQLVKVAWERAGIEEHTW
ncbi:uncharacterized protein [Arachis hypogaea]|uniref:uncharacterized protein n=1 Tax=Arachis hypogaea TaxID=3818 RepID=UPI003B2203EB